MRICEVCKKRPAEKKPGGYRRRCNTCRQGSRNKRRKSYRSRVNLDKCAWCGFVPEHVVQMDVDHIDGNRKNNSPSNLQALCANCHRLKTALAEDHLRRYA